MIHRLFVLRVAAGDDDALFKRFAEAIFESRPGTRHFFYVGADESEAGIFTHRFLSDYGVGPDTIKLVYDTITPSRYLTLDVRHPPTATWLHERLATAATIMSPAELLAEAADESSQPGALMRLALASAGTPDADTIAAVARALGSPRLERRQDAAKAAAFLCRPELSESLRAARETESDPGIQALLDYALLDPESRGDIHRRWLES